MLTSRKKPRSNHVRTGCITCKRRRVKCSEEHPHCNRCIRGQFVCEGYAVPKAWIFESTGRGQAGSDNDSEQSQSSGDAPPTDLSMVVQLPGDSTTKPASVLTSSPLQLGNSDPFDAYAIPIGPLESYILNKYLETVTLQYVQPGSKHRLLSAFGRSYYSGCLQNEAAAYGLLARNAAVMNQTPQSPYALESPSVLNYTTQSQAALRKLLVLVNGSETIETVYAIMWAATFLATIELTLQRPNSQVHVHAICKLVERYVQLVAAEELEPISILYPIHITFYIASMTLTSPLFDMETWFPQTFQPSWNKVKGSLPDRIGVARNDSVHGDVKDPLLQSFIVSQRNSWDAYSYFLGLAQQELSPEDESILTNAIGSHEMWYYGRMLKFAAEAMNSLSRPDLSMDQMRDVAASAYTSISMLLWLHAKNHGLASRRSFAVVGFDLLGHLKNAIGKSELLPGPDRYPTIKLWALFMGLHAEYQRRIVQSLDFACGTWFMDAFRAQASYMHIASWQHAVSVFENVLYDKAMRPHISQWWCQVFSKLCLGDRYAGLQYGNTPPTAYKRMIAGIEILA